MTSRNELAVLEAEDMDQVPTDASQNTARMTGMRFTSNIVGPLLLLRDILSCALAVPIALLLYRWLFGSEIVTAVHLFAGTTMVATFLLIRASKDAYIQNLFSMAERDDSAVFDAVLSGLVATALVFLSGMVENFSRGLSSIYLICTAVLLTASRPLFRRMLDRLSANGVIGQRIAFYGADEESITGICHIMEAEGRPHLRFVGVADDRPNVVAVPGLPYLGGSTDLAELARKGRVDQVLISVRDLSADRLQEIMERLSSVCVDISIVPTQAIDLAPNYRVRLMGSLPVLTLWQRPWRDVSGMVKRLEDIVLASGALVLLSPLMLLTTLLVRFTSRGPILFVQPRIGFNNEVINVLKFRSMYVDRADLKGLDTTVRNDPRLTPAGPFIRKFSLDELPQLLNVIRGDMSMVGPRPHATHMRVGDHYYQEAVKGYAGRHRVKPGITGLAQVKGLRGEIRTMDRARRRVELDLQYIDRWSVWLDLKILLLTVRAVILDDDAY